MRIELTVNGERKETEVWEGESLLFALRERLGLPGSKNACEQGECGSCSVMLDGTMVCACLVLAAQADGHHVVTVEGLAQDGQLHRVQEAFTETGAVQCGFCTPGLIVATADLLDRKQIDLLLEGVDLMMAITRAPNNGDLHYSLGLLLAEEKRLDESTAELGRAAALLPDRSRVQYNYALALQQTGKMKEAEAILLKGYKLNSQDVDMINALARFYAQQEKWDQALTYAQALVRLTSGAPGPTQLLKQIEAKQTSARPRETSR
jgi:carbon-monoxide dehydrogenase small subunit